MNWKIKKSKELYIVIATIFMAVSCGSDSNAGKTALSGTINNASGQKILLEHLLPTKIQGVDSAIIEENGHFAFNNVLVEEIGFYRIKQSDQNFITVILAPGEEASLTSDWNLGMGPYTIEGSPESKRLQALNVQMAKLFSARDSMNMLFQNNQGNEKLMMQLQSEFAIIAKENQEFAKNFITEDPSSLACLAAAEQLNPDEDADLLRLIDTELAAKYGNSVYYTEFHKVVSKLDFLAIGSEVPDIILPNPDGEMVQLSSLRGKVVLIDFWASWCKPCRMENPNVVAAYKKYNDKGFEVFGVSLDKDRERWLAAINDDQLFWTQVSDLKFWNSAAAKLYDVKGIPFALLIDAEGRVIAKNLRGPALEEKLEEILN